MSVDLIKHIIGRIVAVFIASALSVIGAGAIAGISIFESMLVAGLAGTAAVVEGLARAYLGDGKLRMSEINAVFGRESIGKTPDE